MIAMHELFSKPTNPKTRLENQEYYHRLREIDGASGRYYCVLESHAHWDDGTKEMVWDAPQSETFSTLARAKVRYAERRLS